MPVVPFSVYFTTPPVSYCGLHMLLQNVLISHNVHALPLCVWGIMLSYHLKHVLLWLDQRGNSFVNTKGITCVNYPCLVYVKERKTHLHYLSLLNIELAQLVLPGKYWMKLFIPSQKSTLAPLEFGNGYKISTPYFAMDVFTNPYWDWS